jgi:predicted dehydrogenase
MITIGQLGCGYWGPNLLRNFLKIDDVHQIFVNDTNEEMLTKIKSEFISIETGLSTNDIIESKKINAIVIALPAALHYEYTKKALLADKHVLVEKPLSMKSDESLELIRMAKEKNKVLMVGHTFLYNSAVRKAKEYIDSGELGDIYYIFSQRLNLGRVRQDINAMWNLAPHDISIINYWLGETPSNVMAKGVSFLQEGIEDLVFIHLDFPSGKSAHIHVTWLDPLKTRKMVIVGSKKMLVYDDVSTDSKIMILDKGIDKSLKENFEHEIYDYALFQLKNRIGDILIPHFNFDEPLKSECKHFVDCIINGNNPLTDGENGLEVVKVLEAAQKHLDAQPK